MVVALFGLSLVMIVGGIAAVVQGFPYVRLESGLAMVIGGSTAASAGVILLGLAAIAMRLSQLQQALTDARSTPAPSKAVEAIPVPPPVPAPAIAGTAGLAGLTVGSAGLRTEPRIDDVPASKPMNEKPSTEPRVEAIPAADEEPSFPELLPEVEPAVVPPPRIDRREPRLSVEPERSPEDDLFTPGKPGLRLSDPEGEDEKRPVDRELPEARAEDKADAKSEERVVVGTYASGGNTYVMFADGSIEADTPRGRFNFGSLTELKAFVEAGGESGDTRGAA